MVMFKSDSYSKIELKMSLNDSYSIGSLFQGVGFLEDGSVRGDDHPQLLGHLPDGRVGVTLGQRLQVVERRLKQPPVRRSDVLLNHLWEKNRELRSDVERTKILSNKISSIMSQ